MTGTVLHKLLHLALVTALLSRYCSIKWVTGEEGGRTRRSNPRAPPRVDLRNYSRQEGARRVDWEEGVPKSRGRFSSPSYDWLS